MDIFDVSYGGIIPFLLGGFLGIVLIAAIVVGAAFAIKYAIRKAVEKWR